MLGKLWQPDNCLGVCVCVRVTHDIAPAAAASGDPRKQKSVVHICVAQNFKGV